MRKWHTWTVVGFVALLAGLLVFTGPAAGQVKKKAAVFQVAQPGQAFPPPAFSKVSPGVNPASLYSGIKLIEESKFRDVINAANDCIKDAVDAAKKGKFEQANNDWNQAAHAIQTVLNLKEDFHVQVRQRDPQGQDTVRWASVKFEANNLLGSMPKEGLEVYEVKYGGEASKLLKEAKDNGDRELLADVATRFAHTKAGIEANEILATFFLDRGQFFMSALRYERLLDMNSDRVKVDDLTLFKAALAYRRAGEIKQSEALWKKLEANVFPKGGLKVGDQLIAVARLEQALQEVRPPETTGVHDWPLIRGNLTNSAQAIGSQPLLEKPLWRRPLMLDPEVEERADKGKEASDKIENALKTVERMPNTPVLPGGFPIAIGKLLLYRTYSDVRAVSLREQKDAAGKVIIKPGDFIWKTTDLDGGLANVLDKDNRARSMVEMWLNSYMTNPAFANLVYENTLNGTISTDHRHLYVVDDLAVPMPSNMFNQFAWNQSNLPIELKNLVMGNSLQAYDIFHEEGKLKWRKGDPLGKDKDPNDPFKDSHFLGPPISVGGKLYILNEKNNGQPSGDADLRLFCLDPLTGNVIGPAQGQPLGNVLQNYRITHDISRRTNAVHLGYGEGILVCPTNAGQVLGVDLLSRTLAWAYPYRETAPTQPARVPGGPGMGVPIGPGMQGMPAGMPGVMNVKWKSAPPVISEGKVVFTAPDADSIHCINLRDGWKVWSKRQDESAGDLFLGGVYSGKVVVVGKNAVRLLKLATGEQVAYLPTGDLPSGQGVASKNVYYLPLAKGEICAIDLERNTIKAHNRTSKTAGTAPGNLIFHEGAVISQRPTEIVAYPQLTARLEAANKAVENDPNSPDKLYDRGVYRLADGQVQRAVDDFREALKLNPPAELTAQVRRQYYEALTDVFQTDFNSAAAQYLEDFRELSKASDSPDEREQRQARFFRIVGHGRENQGHLVEAYEMYKNFAKLSINQQGVANIDDPSRKVPTNVWLKGRIAGMMAKATPHQREPLDARIAEEWTTVKAKNDVAEVRDIVARFDVPFSVGREARLQLAEAIVAKNDAAAYLEAELSLEQLRVGDYRKDAKVGGRALAGLVALEMKKGKVENMKLAAAYCRELAREFPDTVIADGRTGKDFLNRLAELPPRYFPYLEEGGPFWKDAKIAAREVAGGNLPMHLQGLMFYPEGDVTPGMKNLRIVFNPSNAYRPRAHLVDMSTGAARWDLDLLPNQPNQATNQYFSHLSTVGSANTHFRPDARFRMFQVKGHLAVLQVGPHVFAIDLNSPRVLWQHDVLQLPANTQVQQALFDAEGHFEVALWNQFTQQRTVTRVGSVGAVEASYVALVTHKGLVVLDPLRGTQLWSKTDVPTRTKVFGDNEYLYLLETHDGGSATAGRCLRASDGTPVNVEDFGSVYLNRVRLDGRRILAAVSGRDNLTLRLYDVPAGKDLWAKDFHAKAVVLRTEDPALTGVIEPDGKVVVLDASSGKELLTTSVLQNPSPKVESRITKDDLKNLSEPLLLADSDRFYVALNQLPDIGQVSGGVVSSNFSNGVRCAPLNGWFVALHRKDGEIKRDGQVRGFKKGELAWYSDSPMSHQLIVLEQFDNLPVVLFSSRYNKLLGPGTGGNPWLSVTRSLDKKFGRTLFSAERTTGPQPQFHAFNVDLKAGTITMINANVNAANGSVLHYIDDGRKIPDARSDVPQSGGATSGVPRGIGLPRGAMPVPPGKFGPAPGLLPAQPPPLPPPLPPPPPPKLELRDGLVVPGPVIRQLDLPPAKK